jgi:arylsulfatase A-like enzyme
LTAPDRPNILFVFSDQQRYEAMGCSGNDLIRTPNFDRIGREGVILDQAIASHPICSPFRGQLLSGQYGHVHGVVCNEYDLHKTPDLLGRRLQSAGYRTEYIGKLHLGDGPYDEQTRAGFGFDFMSANNCQHRYFAVEYHEQDAGPLRFDGWAPTGETDVAIRQLETHAAEQSGQPLAMFLGWGPPHWPYDHIPDELNNYSPDDIRLPPNVPRPLAPFSRWEIAHYYANCTGLDIEMGRLLDALDRLGLAENTIVVYTSDHGDHLWAHGMGKPSDDWLPPYMRGSKATVFGESCHVPFVVRWPAGISPGRRTDALFNSVDIAPTLLSLCGLDAPETMHGTDMSHLLTGGEGPTNDSIYLMNMGPGWPYRGDWVGCWRGLRDGRYSYARWHDNYRPTALFDRQEDPHEQNNLAGTTEAADIEQRMESRLREWMRRLEDPFETGRRNSQGMLRVGQRYADPEKWGDAEG